MVDALKRCLIPPAIFSTMPLQIGVCPRLRCYLLKDCAIIERQLLHRSMPPVMPVQRSDNVQQAIISHSAALLAPISNPVSEA